VICALASRLGADHPGFSMTAMELVDATLRASGYEGAKAVIAGRWVDRQPSFRESHFLDGFSHPGGRFRFAPDWADVGPDHATMPRLPDHWDCYDTANEQHPFRLVTAPARQFLNTSFTETPSSRRREGRPTALLHPADAARLGVTPGDRLRLGNRLGEVILHAEIGANQQVGTVIVESVWPNAAFEGGIGINALTSDDPAFPNGGAVFHDTAVWVRAEAASLAIAAE
jgi:anaerobic selenocysteine-containing dehydrogenase